MYIELEPFGEERRDLRMASMNRMALDIARGGKGRKFTLGELTLYPDIQQASSEGSNRQEAEAVLSRFAEKSSG